MDKTNTKIVEISEVKHNFDLDIFEGPLDVLLHLARTSQIEIIDISLNKLIDQYIFYIESVQDKGINVASEYIEMAAELIRIKSKSLLPGNQLDDLEELLDGTLTREQLIEKLIEYKKYKDIAPELESLHDSKPKVFYKPMSKMSELRDNNFNASIDIDKLKLAMQSVLITQEVNTTETKMIEVTELDVETKINKLRSVEKPTKFINLISKVERTDKVAYFLGLLEAVKLGYVHIGFELDEILIYPGAYDEK